METFLAIITPISIILMIMLVSFIINLNLMSRINEIRHGYAELDNVDIMFCLIVAVLSIGFATVVLCVIWIAVVLSEKNLLNSTMQKIGKFRFVKKKNKSLEGVGGPSTSV